MASGHQSHNLLLAALPSADFELIRPNLQTIDLPAGLTLVESGEIPTRAYFPHSGVIASTVSLSTGRVVEVRITGREGAVGAVTGAGQLASFTSAVVRIKGTSSVIDHPNFQMVFNRSQSLRALLARQEAVQQAMADQSVACNAAHDLEARLARRLLRLCTMSGQTEFTATQEVVAEMLGVQRNAISHVAHGMREMNVISYSRGLLKIVDFDRLHRLSCECYDTVTAYRAALESD
jgi:CRP-like cAMP-binding protein